uniref:Reverse transcriptase domain-containing protein n=1 Tax=Heliothis virescens TaxID=7102 RepID=A0A2A4JRM8_HELVI
MDEVADLNDSFFSCSSSDSFASADSDSSPPLTLHDKLFSLFSNDPKNLHVAHINAQSVPGHYSDLLASFSSAHLDALLISESFLKPSLLSTQFSLPGFVLIRNDRTGKGGGGVAMYLRAGIPYKVISSSPSLYSESAEYLFIEITIHHTNILLAVFYSPNLHIDYFDSFDSILSNLCPVYEHVIIMGDFNTCLIKNDSRTFKINSLLSSYNLQILPLSATHNSPNCSPSLLDLMIVSSPDNVSYHGQLVAPFSYHDLIYLSYRIQVPRRRAQVLYLRNFKGIDLEELRRDAGDINWLPLAECTNIDDKIEYLNSTILNLFDQHAPVRQVKVRHDPAPWISPQIKELMARRDKAKKRYKRRPSELNLAYYKSLRNRCNHLCRDARRRYFHDSLSNHNSSDIWKFLKSVGIGKSPVSQCKDVNLNDLNKHFSILPFSLDPGVKTSTLDSLSRLPVPQYSLFNLCDVTEEDVKKSVLAITSSAVGNDKLCSRMITLILSSLLPVLTHIFNYSFSSCSFPSAWKQAHIIPLPKTNNPTLLTHFRPISILPFLSKVFEHLVHKQLSFFLTSNSIISPFQSGFRAGHSTVTALLKVTDDIRWAMENRCLTVLVLLDFSSAFNSVDFDILLGILKSINFSSSALTWFNSYLRGRSQCVRLQESHSDWCNLTEGVPQGSVLSPILFSIFINSVITVISSSFHLYADDLQLYRHFPVADANSAIAAMNRDLACVSDWAKSFGLQINPAKSQAMIIGSRFFRNAVDVTSLPPLYLDGVCIDYTVTAKDLGVTIDSNLSWSAHVNEVSRKVHFSMHTLRCLQNFLPLKTKICLAQSLIQPIIDYADACYLDATEELLNKLERLQNLCIRFVFGLRKYDHVSHLRKELKWLPIRLRRNTRILCLLFNILHNPSYPPYLRERFSYARTNDAPCRSHLRTLLKVLPHKTDYYSYSFTIHAVRLWNSLPPSIRDIKTISLFKKRVKEHYLSS